MMVGEKRHPLSVATTKLAVANFICRMRLFPGNGGVFLTAPPWCRYRCFMSSEKLARHASSAVEDYLERILELINTKGYARVVDIAGSLGISQASVTNMVQRLDAEGLLKYEKYRGLVLTTAGEELARNITRRHQLLTDFLKLLGLDDDVIYHDVEGMEHHISPPTLRAIEALTSHLQRQPALLAKVRAQIDEN
jgi:Mn-dependent DtxR family transcriptional regulator